MGINIQFGGGSSDHALDYGGLRQSNSGRAKYFVD